MSINSNNIEVLGAREHNLRNIDVKIPRDNLVVITGLSGSGKSSLAFDTIYAEGQRRYIETFSVYARQHLSNLERPDVDKINGLSPVIAIEQKTTSKNPRSTVGTVTELYDFIRLLYARIGVAYSYLTNEKMVSHTNEQILEIIQKKYQNEKIVILAPLVRARKGHYRSLFKKLILKGFTKVRIDGTIQDLTHDLALARYESHDIELVIDRLDFTQKSTEKLSKRLAKTIQLGMTMGEGSLMVTTIDDKKIQYYSKELVCPTSGVSYLKPEPNTFSFNSRKGMCPECNGLGVTSYIDEEKLITNPYTPISEGGIAKIKEYSRPGIFIEMEKIARHFKFSLHSSPLAIPKDGLNALLHGFHETVPVKLYGSKLSFVQEIDFDGIISYIEDSLKDNPTPSIKKWATQFYSTTKCLKCDGNRLSMVSNQFKINNCSITDISQWNLIKLSKWFLDLPNHLTKNENIIGSEIIKEINKRLQFLLNVGLGYLQLNRPTGSLSGGEAQRIRLATQIGSQLVGVLYILDEPSIGLHQRDNNQLIDSLKKLKDLGNSIIVVEHDKEMMLRADYVIDLGPGGGNNGGEIVSIGTPKEVSMHETLTGKYLAGKLDIEIPKKRRVGTKKFIRLTGCKGNNLKDVDLKIPLGKMIGVTGVSGSGKSSLINQTLYPVLKNRIYRSIEPFPLEYQSIQGAKNIDKVIDINQSPIGRTPRSNPVTYCNVFTHIRELFAQTMESMIRGYKIGRFSFNVREGRCPNCEGTGVNEVAMNYLPDIEMECFICQGSRYNHETLEIKYKEKNISDVLNMTFNEACEFFQAIPKIYKRLKVIRDVGLGYLKLGQSSTTLSGGEAQRIKLASELTKVATGKTLYILDEPTTGLHLEDIRVLLDVLNRLVDKGNTVIIIEHNLDVIKQVDYIIDIGPEGGEEGGEIVCQGSPEKIIKCPTSHTGKYLKKELLASSNGVHINT